MARFKLLAGEFRDRSGSVHVFVKGQETFVESDDPLDEMFLNQFEKVGSPKLTSIPEKGEQFLGMDETPIQARHTPATRNVIPPAEPTGNKTEISLGEDKTEDFPKATQYSLRVFKRAKGRLFICDESDLAKPLNHNAGYSTKDQVNNFIEKWVEKQPKYKVRERLGE